MTARPTRALDAFYQYALPDVPPGPQWLHEIAMVDFDYMSDGGKGWFKDIDALAAALSPQNASKVFLCLHGWYDWCGRYSFDAKTKQFDKQWTAFGNAPRYKGSTHRSKSAAKRWTAALKVPAGSA